MELPPLLSLLLPLLLPSLVPTLVLGLVRQSPLPQQHRHSHRRYVHKVHMCCLAGQTFYSLLLYLWFSKFYKST